MELFIALAILIGLVELKEFRQTKRVNILADKIAETSKSFKNISDQLNSLKETFSMHREDLHKMSEEVRAVAEVIHQTKQITEETKAEVDTILKEYEINGVPIGYQRRQADFIEGL